MNSNINSESYNTIRNFLSSNPGYTRFEDIDLPNRNDEASRDIRLGIYDQVIKNQIKTFYDNGEFRLKCVRTRGPGVMGNFRDWKKICRQLLGFPDYVDELQYVYNNLTSEISIKKFENQECWFANCFLDELERQCRWYDCDSNDEQDYIDIIYSAILVIHERVDDEWL